MKFPLPVKKRLNLEKYDKSEIDLAREFSKKIFKEVGTFIKAVVLFGSSARGKRKEKGDIDILVIVDDVTMMMTPEFVEAYRIVTQNVIASVSERLHVMSLKISTFWEYIRIGDPIAMNILRDGVALVDIGFFDPAQALLFQGRIRPSLESVWTYFGRAPRTLLNSRWHLIQATLDLYWAVIDAAHAALMKLGEIPPTPEHVADLLQQKMVKKHLLEKKYITTMREFYKLMKMIVHREIKEVKGAEYERYYKDAHAFVERMKSFIYEKEEKK
jgi:predicted nucleotidyltransferase/uncharacterized protein (UPF0332 family)